MSGQVELHTGHGTVLFEFTRHHLYVYTTCCGAKVPRRKAKRLHKALTKWLTKGNR